MHCSIKLKTSILCKGHAYAASFLQYYKDSNYAHCAQIQECISRLKFSCSSAWKTQGDFSDANETERSQQGGLTFGDWDNVSKLQISDWEVDDGGVLLPEEVVLGEALHVQHQVGGQPRQPVPPPPGLYVIVYAPAVKLPQQLKDGHLRTRQPSVSACTIAAALLYISAAWNPHCSSLDSSFAVLIQHAPTKKSSK